MQKTQVQKRSKENIDAKLDGMLKRLNTPMDMVEDEICPDESRMKKSYMAREAKG